ncbi:MAG: branched-chain amino acid ABC transporter permease [Candidatus Hodarchaeota archaeon]
MITDLMQVLVLGSVQGAVFMLIAVGYSLVYGAGGIMNLAHGAFYLIAGYMLYWYLDTIGLFLAAALAVIMVTIIGAISYYALIKPLEKKSHLSVVMVTFAIAFFIEQMIKLGCTLLDFEEESILPNLIEINGTVSFELLGIDIPYDYIFILIISFIIVGFITLFISKSKLGTSIRAISQDREAAMLMGINADRVLMYTVMISAFLAAIAAVIYVPSYPITPWQGWLILTNSFAVVILGGMGSLPGSVIGAFILSYASHFTRVFIDPAISTLVPVIVIVVMLVFRPRGILGKKEID